MGAYNEFRFIGKCYGDSTKVLTKDSKNGIKRYYTKITLVVKSRINNKKNNYIPITANGELAEKANLLCRNCNVVAIVGEIVTRELFDRNTGEVKIQTHFIANDIMLITKPTKKIINLKQYSDLVELASIEEFEPPKRKKG